MTSIDPDIQKLIAENEKLIDQVQAFLFDNVCNAQGVDPARVRAAVAKLSDAKTQAQAAQEIAQDRAEVEQQIDAEATRRGLRRPGVATGGIRRRMGQML